MNDWRRFPVTAGVIGVCLVVYLYTTMRFGFMMDAYDALMTGGYNPVYTFNYHQYFRLMTANFLHFGLMHLVMNLYALYNLGSLMELVLKKYQYVILLIVSAITTNLLPGLVYLVNGYESNVVSGGISGVIFGIIGGIGALALTRGHIFKDIFRELSVNLVIMLALSFLVPQISLSGHIGGLIGGFLVTMAMTYKKRQNLYH